MNEDAGLVVFGAGGHGRVVADCAALLGSNLLGYVDDHLPAGTRIGNLSVLGSGRWLSERRDVSVLLGIGDNLTRERIAKTLESARITIRTIVHPRAVVSPGSELGAGTVVLALAVVNTGARIGRGVIINSAAVVEHDVEIGDFAHASPNSTLGGGARLGQGAHLGLSACVLPGKSIGPRTVVGAGAVVTRDLDGALVVAGVPAHPLASRRKPE